MEVALLRKVNEKRHSGIVEVLEWFECADCFLVVMARPTPVMDLFDYVSKRKRLNEAEARFVSNFFGKKCYFRQNLIHIEISRKSVSRGNTFLRNKM